MPGVKHGRVQLKLGRVRSFGSFWSIGKANPSPQEELAHVHRKITSLALAATIEGDITSEQATVLIKDPDSGIHAHTQKRNACTFLEIVT
jgi:hypothetical protein